MCSTTPTPLNAGKLWIVATPLGNPGDLSPRARDVLASVDGVLAEDTRRAGQLFSRCGISAPPFTSFHDHNEKDRLAQIIGWLLEGKNLALVSDAGTPLLSDPGYLLVRACRKQGIAVSPIPGPSAVATALSASGLPPQPFVFLGFPPRKRVDQERMFALYASLPLTLVFFERKDRVKETLQTALAVLGPREGCIARELTKTYEEFLPFDLAQFTTLPDDLLGEITVILGPPQAGGKTSADKVAEVVYEEREEGGKPKEIAKRVQERVDGWTLKELYDFLQSLPANSKAGAEATAHSEGKYCKENGKRRTQ